VFVSVTWAVIGAVFLSYAGWVLVRWAADGGLRLMPLGTSNISPTRIALVWAVHVFTLSMVAVCIWCSVRTSRREGRVSMLAALTFGYFTMFWQDPNFNYSHMTINLNREALSVPTWGPYIMGWHGPHPELQREHILASGIIAYALSPIMVWAPWVPLRRFLRTRPHWGTGKTLSLIALACIITDLVLEQIWLLTGLYSFPAMSGNWALFGGHWYRYSLFASPWVTATFLFAAVVMIERAHRKGTDTWLLAGSQNPWVRLLAGAGLCNVMMFVYIIGFNLIPALTAGTMPADTPDYLRP
jgi:hypothetical protein